MFGYRRNTGGTEGIDVRQTPAGENQLPSRPTRK